VVAVVASFVSLYKVGLMPPKVQPRELQIAAASTTVLIDGRHTLVLNLAANSYDFGSAQSRSVLLVNLMVTDPVKRIIARLARVPFAQLEANAPITSNVPQTFIEPGSGAAATDILASPDHYKLQLQVDPQVPIVHIYAQAPSVDSATRLANAAVEGLREYLGTLDVTQNIDPEHQLKLYQFGVSAGVVNGGAGIQIALLTFITVFASACAVAVAASRVRLGWLLAGNRVPERQ
jgi:hypothetical protein